MRVDALREALAGVDGNAEVIIHDPRTDPNDIDTFLIDGHDFVLVAGDEVSPYGYFRVLMGDEVPDPTREDDSDASSA